MRTDARPRRLVALVIRVYTMFFLSFPRDFRLKEGVEVRKAFGDGCRARARQGIAPLIGYALRGYADAVREGLAERRDQSRCRAASSSRLPAPESIGQDFRFAVRTFARRPGFTTVALLTLALGIGAATAIFSAVNGVLLEPFPYADSGELVVLWNTNPRRGQDEYRFAGRVFLEIEPSARSFRDMAMVAGATASLTGKDLPPMRVVGAAVSANLFQLLGVNPELGRSFFPEENQGEHRVAILSRALWLGRFGGDPDIIGRSILLDGSPTEVVGVMPSVPLPLGGGTLSLAGPDDPAYWMPLDYTLGWVSEIDAHVMAVVARLNPGVGLHQARSEMASMAQAREETVGAPGEGIIVRPFREQIIGDIRHNLFILLGAVGLLLLMACGNLATLFLARATDREREMAVRAAVGAGRGRLVRQVLTEILLLGLLGGILGLVLAHRGTGALLALMPSDLPRQSEIGVDGTVLLFTFMSVLLATLGAGLVPSLRAAGRDPSRGLRTGGRGGSPARERNRANRTIVVLQFGLATVLLVGAGLLTKSLSSLRSVDPGFRSAGILTSQLFLPDTRYGNAQASLAFFDELRRRVEALPGVSSAVFSMDHPLENSWWNALSLLDQPPPPAGELRQAIFRPVSEGYFRAYGIPLLEGRSFESRDRLGAPGVMVVNQAFVERFFPDGNALRQRIRFTVGTFIWGSESTDAFEVVGVVGNVRFNGLREPTEPAFYVPTGQFPYAAMKLQVRAELDPAALVDLLQREVWRLDPDLPVTDVQTMDRVVAAATAQDRFNAILLGAFAVAALVLAAAGVFGVLSYMVSQRSRELGIRLALGAEPLAVLGMVVRNGATLAGIGLAGGLAGAAALAPLLASLLFGVHPRDPVTFACVGGLLGFAALASAFVPALRAARTDPMETLKGE